MLLSIHALDFPLKKTLRQVKEVVSFFHFCWCYWMDMWFSQLSKLESAEDIPVTPPLNKERVPRNLNRPTGMATGYSSSDSFDHHSMQSRHHHHHHDGSSGLNSTPKVSTISTTKTEEASSIRSSSSREADPSGDISISNVSDQDTEWVEQDEPGVYLTIRALPGGKRELRRVRFRYDVCHQLLLEKHGNLKHMKWAICVCKKLV